ncbi:MAG TPA: ABC transporter substrate-binding protein [Trueperaceae bacterium]|nr:ABC transporter substrate-binding protein [Trueperaceae bacterium]
MPRRALFALLLLLVAPLAFAQIKIGALYNLTGDMSSIDAPGYNGMRLAVQQINENGGLLGQQIELVSVDGQTDQTQLTNAASRLVDVENVVAVAGINDSTFALAAGPIMQAAGVPYVISGGTLPTLPEQIGEYAFMAPFGDDAQSQAIVDFAVNELGVESYYMLYDQAYDFTLAVREFANERFAELLGEDALLLEDSYQSGDADFSSQIARLRALEEQPDAIFMSAVPSDAGNLVQQFREAGFEQPILSADGFDTPLLVEVAGDLANGVYFSTHVSLTSDDPQVQEFVAAYEAEYGNPPENAFAALGYDSMLLIADAIERAGSAEPDAIRDALAETSGLDLVTGVISYEGDSRVPTKSVTIMGVDNGEYVFQTEVTP